VDTIVDLMPDACRHLRAPVHAGDDVGDPRRHPITEPPPIAAHITEYRCHRRRCPLCGTTTLAPLPHELASQFGPQLTALIAYLTVVCRLPRQVVQRLRLRLAGDRMMWVERDTSGRTRLALRGEVARPALRHGYAGTSFAPAESIAIVHATELFQEVGHGANDDHGLDDITRRRPVHSTDTAAAGGALCTRRGPTVGVDSTTALLLVDRIQTILDEAVKNESSTSVTAVGSSGTRDAKAADGRIRIDRSLVDEIRAELGQISTLIKQ
jgi:hypothetical protein